MQQNRRGGNGWIGWLIFIVLVFGSRFLPPVANWLAQTTGLPITTPLLIAAIVGIGVVGSIVGSIMRGVSSNRDASETRLPTGQPPAAPTLPPRTITPPTAPPLPRSSSSNLPSARPRPNQQPLPGPPRFEPIIDPRVLTFGIIGLVVFGGFLLVALLLAGSLP